MNKKIILILFSIILVFVLGYSLLQAKSHFSQQKPQVGPSLQLTGTPTTTLLKVCPEEWFSNQMPSTIESNTRVSKEYFIYKGVRRELLEFDVDWVKTNCSVKPQVVE
ncbi:MAG: hypothetical protein WCG84_00645 [Candidatus Moraniibacteriota bacterium]